MEKDAQSDAVKEGDATMIINDMEPGQIFFLLSPFIAPSYEKNDDSSQC